MKAIERAKGYTESGAGGGCVPRLKEITLYVNTSLNVISHLIK